MHVDSNSGKTGLDALSMCTHFGKVCTGLKKLPILGYIYIYIYIYELWFLGGLPSAFLESVSSVSCVK